MDSYCETILKTRSVKQKPPFYSFSRNEYLNVFCKKYNKTPKIIVVNISFSELQENSNNIINYIYEEQTPITS